MFTNAPDRQISVEKRDLESNLTSIIKLALNFRYLATCLLTYQRAQTCSSRFSSLLSTSLVKPLEHWNGQILYISFDNSYSTLWVEVLEFWCGSQSNITKVRITLFIFIYITAGYFNNELKKDKEMFGEEAPDESEELDDKDDTITGDEETVEDDDNDFPRNENENDEDDNSGSTNQAEEKRDEL